jgi:hypothetical protein
MPTYAEWVSTAAFGLATVSLGWQVARSRWDQPRLTVSGAWSLESGLDRYGDPTSDPDTWVLDVNMSNIGERAVTVTEVYWQLESPASGVNRLTSSRVSGPVPRRLEPHDHEAWQIRLDLHGTLWNGRRARPAATIIRRHGFIQRRHGAEPETPVYGPWFRLSDPRQSV